MLREAGRKIRGVRAPFAPPIDALGGLPGAHLGLTWSAVVAGSFADLERLVDRCEAQDAALVRMPAPVLEHLFLPRVAGHVAMLGRDSRGEARACASVRILAAGPHDVVALRASIDPPWRGRGIGRAVLAWQDRWALGLLRQAGGDASTVGAPIPAHLVDRRRLYTAAGFSCRARIELHGGPAADGPAGRSRALAPTDAPGVARLGAGEEPHALVGRALTAAEALATSDPGLSRVVEGRDAPLGVALASRTTDRAGIPLAHVHTLLLAKAAGGDIAEELVRGALQAAARGGLPRVVISVPPTVGPWRDAVARSGLTPIGSHLLYAIEMP